MRSIFQRRSLLAVIVATVAALAIAACGSSSSSTTSSTAGGSTGASGSTGSSGSSASYLAPYKAALAAAAKPVSWDGPTTPAAAPKHLVVGAVNCSYTVEGCKSGGETFVKPSPRRSAGRRS